MTTSSEQVSCTLQLCNQPLYITACFCLRNFKVPVSTAKMSQDHFFPRYMWGQDPAEFQTTCPKIRRVVADINRIVMGDHFCFPLQESTPPHHQSRSSLPAARLMPRFHATTVNKSLSNARREICWEGTNTTGPSVEAALERLQFTQSTVEKIGEVFLDELEKGIHEQASSLQMENTYIPELPDGTEQGQFLALDLGGTNFRIILLVLKDGKVVDEKVKHYHIVEELRLGCGERLFDYLAECVSDFVKLHKLTGARLPLGFTFSFPMTQKALDVGILVTWTKSFNCPSVVGRDAVQMLRDAIHKRGDTHVEVLAVLNDTTGTLVQGAVLDSRTAIGLIIGTGSNACYLERADRVQHWEGQRHGEKQVIIDIEWGAFGDNGVLDFIKTEYDREVDRKSLLATSFTFEKYISGKYLGEIVRVILVKLSSDGLLFGGAPSKKLLTHGSFTTSLVSLIEQDTVDGGSKNTIDVLDKFELSADNDDVAIVKYVCEVASNRSALLVSICLAKLLIRMNRPDTTIAVDGSLYKHHPRLKHWLNKYIRLFAPDQKFRLLLAEDGSGKGAGIVAAIALRLKERFQET